MKLWLVNDEGEVGEVEFVENEYGFWHAADGFFDEKSEQAGRLLLALANKLDE